MHSGPDQQNVFSKSLNLTTVNRYIQQRRIERVSLDNLYCDNRIFVRLEKINTLFIKDTVQQNTLQESCNHNIANEQ